MSLIIYQNISALNTHRLLLLHDRILSNSVEKLSSGLRINRAADDSAGLTISQRLRALVESLYMASLNAEQATNLFQTAEGYLNEIHNILSRMRELAVQASSDTVDDTNRQSLQAEFDSLRSEIIRIANAAEYNNQKLFDGLFNKTFQIGPNNSIYDVITFSISAVDAISLGIDITDISNLSSANTALDDLMSAIDEVSSIRSDLGTYQNRLLFSISSIDNAAENLASSESTIRDLDVSKALIEFTKYQILFQSSMAMLAHSNAIPQSVLALFI